MSTGEIIPANSSDMSSLQVIPIGNGELENSRSTDHLWKPGQSGNPNGRPPTKAIGDYLKFQLEQLGYTAKIGDDLLKAAAGEKQLRPGQLDAAGLVLDRTEGKAVQNTNLRAVVVMMPAEAALAETWDAAEPD